MTYAQWLDKLAVEREAKAAARGVWWPAYGERSREASRMEAILSLSAEAATLDPSLNRSGDPDAELPIGASKEAQ